MSLFSLLMLVIQVFVRPRFPFGLALATAADRLKPLVPAGDVPAAALAAPEELSRTVVDLLNGLVDKIDRPLIRLVLRRAVEQVPAIIDTLWDRLFDQGVVGFRHPPALAATADYEPEDTELTAAVAAELGERTAA